MGRIEVVTKYEQILDIEAIVGLIQRQMDLIQGSSDRTRICHALRNALTISKRAVLFLWYSKDDENKAFAFCNICAGLEAGADYLWINELFVDSSFRNRHVVSSMIEYIEDWARQNEVEYIACVTGEQNLPAKRLYEKSGFEVHSVAWVDKRIQ